MPEETMETQDIEVQEKPVQPVEAVEAVEAVAAAEEEISEEEEMKLPFPNATVVRLMKNSMDGEKMLKKEVKIAMNKWLGSLCHNVSKEMNKFPYVMMHLHEFRKATETYSNLAKFHQEKERILSHLDAIKKDIERLERDMGKQEEDVF